MVDARNVKTASRATRQDLAASAQPISVAVLVDSSVSRVLGNVFLGFNKPAYPTQLFTSEDEAVAWLKGFLE